jgi:two-component system, NtrC family, response regulator AlgB
VILWPSQIIEPEAFPEQIACQVSGNAGPGRELFPGAHRAGAYPPGPGPHATMEEAAHILGIDSSTLWRKRKKYEEES